MLEISKANISIAINAILWYGTGCHARNVDINLETLEKIFECDDNASRQELYNNLIGYDVDYECSFIKGNKIEVSPIKECYFNIPLSIRAILYSFKGDELFCDDIDDMSISMTEFTKDVDEHIRYMLQ